MASRGYGKFFLHLAKADIDWDSVSLKAMICDAGYTPDFDAHEFRSSVTNEVSGSGYTAGGVSLTTEAVALDAPNDRVKFTADDADFGTVTFTAGTQIVVYVDTGSSATDILVSNHTFASQSPVAQSFKYQFNGGIIGYITY